MLTSDRTYETIRRWRVVTYGSLKMPLCPESWSAVNSQFLHLVPYHNDVGVFADIHVEPGRAMPVRCCSVRLRNAPKTLNLVLGSPDTSGGSSCRYVRQNINKSPAHFRTARKFLTLPSTVIETYYGSHWTDQN